MITMSRPIATLAAAAALLLLGACSGGAPDPAAAPGTTTPASPTAQPYTSLTALRDAAVAAGYTCANWTLHAEDDGPEHAEESGQCSDADVFALYASDADLTAQVRLIEQLGSITEMNVLVGPNWSINPETQAEVQQLRAKLGGEHVRAVPQGEATDEPTTPEADADYVPRKSDFEVSIKVLDKQCFGSAGCLVEFRPRIKDASDGRLPDTGTIEVSYKVTGAEDPIQGTFEIDLDADTVEGQDDETTQTPNSSSKLKIAITDMEYYE